MNPKIKKLRAELDKNRQKIATLQERSQELEKQIRDLENIDIVGLVRAKGYTLEQFSDLIKTLQANPISKEQEVSDQNETQPEMPIPSAD